MSEIDEVLLAEAIDRYAQNKSEKDKYDKLCKPDNDFIKSTMIEAKYTDFESDYNVAKVTAVDKGYTDEAKLINVIHSFNIPNSLGIIKTKEYIDEDALESAIYNGEIPQEVMNEIVKCKVEKTEYRLTIKKKKGE